MSIWISSTTTLVPLGPDDDRERQLRPIPSCPPTAYRTPGPPPSRRRSVFKSIRRLSMSVAPSWDPNPSSRQAAAAASSAPDAATFLNSPYRTSPPSSFTQTPAGDPSQRLNTRLPNDSSGSIALSTSNNNSATTVRPLPLPTQGSQNSSHSFSSNEASGHGHGGERPGNRLKALANGQFWRNRSAKGSNQSFSREDSEDSVVYSPSPVDAGPRSRDNSQPLRSASAAQASFLAFDPNQRRPSMPLGRDRSFSDAEGLAPRGGKMSKIQAFTANLRKSHAILTKDYEGGGRSAPAPPPKPDILRAPPSPTHPNPCKVSPTSPSASTNPQNLTATSHASPVIAASPALTNSSLTVPGPNTPPPIGVRNSFQMPNTPSISAAIQYMKDSSDEKDPSKQKTAQGHPCRKEKRRSADMLKSVPESSVPPDDNAKPAIPRPTLNTSPNRSIKRRSASLGDVFKAGWTPAMALASVSPTIPGASRPLNAAQAMKNRPPLLHRRTPSGGSGSSLERVPSNSSPLNPAAANVAKTYQYVNAELLDDDRPSLFVAPRQRHSDGDKNLLPAENFAFPPPTSQQHPAPLTFTVTPASTAAPLPSVPVKPVGGIMMPLLPPRKKASPVDDVSAGDSSGGESSLSVHSRGARQQLKTNLKGRLAALSGANALGNALVPRGPPGSYSAPLTLAPYKQSGSTSMSSGTESSSSPAQSNYSSNQIARNLPPIPTSRTAGPSSRQPLSSPYGPSSATSVAATAGSLGAAAGGMAMNFGRKGLERVGNFLGHRTGFSGNWGSLSGGGYMTAPEELYVRGSSDGSPPGGMAPNIPRGGTRMLGPLLRPPTRAGKGAVFGRSLQDCVAETRIGAGEAGGLEAAIRGQGIWVPALVRRCITHLTLWGLEEEGLFRITGRATHVAKIRGEFDTGADYDLKEAHPSDLDPHAVSSVFKAYLRELPEAILTKRLMPLFDLALSLGMGGQDGALIGVTSFGGGSTFDGQELPTEEAMTELKGLMDQLPKENFDLLHEISKFLRLTSNKASTTKMTLSNLLLVFCPTLQLNPPFLKLIIERQDYLFGNGSMGPVAPPLAARQDNNNTLESTLLKAPGSGPRPRRDGSGEDVRKNRASVVLPGFSVTFEAYAESAAEKASAPIAISRTTTMPNALQPSSRSTTPHSTAPSTPVKPPARGLPTSPALQPSPSGSLRSRVARRQPSLASLFSSNKAPTIPTISNPIPYVPPMPVEPPVLNIGVPDGTFSVGSPLHSTDATAEPGSEQPTSVQDRESPSSSSSDSERLQITPSTDKSQPGPRTMAMEYSPPPRIQMLDSPMKRSTGDGWAAGVLLAAVGET